MTIDYRMRIENLREVKKKHTDVKLAERGYFDVDDHGYIPWDQPIDFEPVVDDQTGRSIGIKNIGENFGRLLEAYPVYIEPNSALAGAWVKAIDEFGGWRQSDFPQELKDRQKKYNLIYHGIDGVNHVCPDMRIGLELGWGGLLKKIRRFRDLNQYQDNDFYDGEEALVLGMQTWIKNHATKARDMAAYEKDPLLQANLIEIAEMNEWLVYNPPRTLREACQFLAWFQSIDRMWGLGGALGQLDQLLRPYYEKDREMGLCDDEMAIWYIASLFYNDTHYSQLGGPDVHGHEMASRISYLILEAAHQLKIPSNLALRVHDEMDRNLLRTAIRHNIKDGTGAAFSCDTGIVEGYRKNSIPLGLARMRNKVGCNWTALPGIEYCLQDVTRHCLVTPFILAFNEMVDDATCENSMEELWKRYVDHLDASVEVLKDGFDLHMKKSATFMPEVVLNLFSHGPVERGLDMAAGGVDIYNLTCDGVGLATVADSFGAIEHWVVDQQKLTWEELKAHLDSDYQGAEEIRSMLKNMDRFGSGKSKGDYWAEKISETYTHLVRDTSTKDGYTMIPGLFSHGVTRDLGAYLQATPNGRHNGDPISHSSEPDPGFAKNTSFAPTLKANAVARVQPGYGNSAPLQIELDKVLLKGNGGIEALEALILGHNKQKGTLINLNVVSKEMILDAHKNPEKYPDLVVRVTGYSGYFRSLSPKYRQEVVDRILALD